MKKKLSLITLVIVFIFTLLLNGSPFIFGDGYGYFHNAKTLVTTGTFQQTSEPEYFPYTGHAVSQENGKFVTTYPVGSSLLMWPFLTISKLIPSGTVYSDYYKAFDGHSLADGVAVLLAASFYMIVAAIIIFKLLKGLGFSGKVSLVSLIAVYIGNYVLSYTEQFASYSHIYEIFAASALLYTLYLFGRKFEYKYMILSGIAAGLLVLIRPIDVVIIIPIFLFCLIYRNRKATLSFLVGGTPFALLFLAFNYTSYGNALATGYGSTEKLFDFSKFNLINLLFSDVRGWFVYSPIMILGVLGIFTYAKRNRPSWLIYVLPSIFLLVSYSFWPNWWAGDSLGQRFLMVLTPFMAIGLANLFKISNEFKFSKILKPTLLLVIAMCSLYSISVAFLYRITPTTILYTENKDTATRYPEVTPVERFTPVDILSYHLSAIAIDGFGTEQYWSDIRQGFNGGRSIFLLAIGSTDPLVKLEKISDKEFNLHLIPNNVGANIISNIGVGIEKQDEYDYFQISNVDFSKNGIIYFNCVNGDHCIVKWDNNEATDYVMKILNLDQNSLPQVQLSEGVKVDFLSQKIIRFVDYKLK